MPYPNGPSDAYLLSTHAGARYIDPKTGLLVGLVGHSMTAADQKQWGRTGRYNHSGWVRRADRLGFANELAGKRVHVSAMNDLHNLSARGTHVHSDRHIR